MAFFSFSLNTIPSEDIFNNKIFFSTSLKVNTKYYSKNTHLWKLLNHNKLSSYVKYINFEERKKVYISKKKKILFCLPPSIGLGDSIEYALGIKSIIEKSIFKKVAVAFVGRYKKIFSKYFDIVNLYEDIISAEEYNSYDIFFHMTLEIKELAFQKYIRSDIEKLIIKFFSTKKYKLKNISRKKTVNKITLFPISDSPIRTMSITLLNFLIDNLSKNYDIQIILNKNNIISKTLHERISLNEKVQILNPKNLDELLKTIELIEFGIFMDSGPLHVAKILNKRGIVIITSVNQKNLVSKYKNIDFFKNDYTSNYCQGPCGLTNIINYNNSIGCYDSLKIKENEIKNTNNLNKLQRGNLKNHYTNFIFNPVNCIKNIDNKKVLEMIKISINK